MFFKCAVIWLVVALSLSGCTNADVLPARIETPVIPVLWYVEVTPDLDWLRPALNTCAHTENSINLVDSAANTAQAPSEEPDYRFTTGGNPLVETHVFELGQQQLEVIVNTHNPVNQLTMDELVKFQSGMITSWDMTEQGSTLGYGEPVMVYHYPIESGIQQQVSLALHLDLNGSVPALLAPGPYETITGITLEKGSIGVIPKNLVTEQIKILTITDFDTSRFTVPILVETKTEPEGSALNFLLCVQRQIN